MPRRSDGSALRSRIPRAVYPPTLRRCLLDETSLSFFCLTQGWGRTSGWTL